MRAHGLRDFMARQQTLNHHLLHLGGSRVIEEPADERDPKPSAKVAANICQTPTKINRKAKNRPTVGSDEGRAAHISCDRPHDGPEHAAAVEWVAGNEVEQHQRQVDVGQVLCQTQERFNAADQRLRPRRKGPPGSSSRAGPHSQ